MTPKRRVQSPCKTKCCNPMPDPANPQISVCSSRRPTPLVTMCDYGTIDLVPLYFMNTFEYECLPLL